MQINNINPTKLHDELIKAGIIPVMVTNDAVDGDYIALNTVIIFADGTDMTAVQAIIDTHDPTPLPQPPSEAEQRIIDLEVAMSYILGGV